MKLGAQKPEVKKKGVTAVLIMELMH